MDQVPKILFVLQLLLQWTNPKPSKVSNSGKMTEKPAGLQKDLGSFSLKDARDLLGLRRFISDLGQRDNGQISGDLLVYRNPGLHFGDIHRLKAVYVKQLEKIVRNAKYGIFFSTQGERSVANEMAIFDFFGKIGLRPGEREARGCSSSTPHGLSPLKASCLCQH
ncbi:hypothetical protein RHMOL_Rhmol01G0119900 [Rhododendron molle]|uniref:Uncharacterized protein n=1 Tax=Rhododendron molle TaxID=49168 RepID=A0ACC0Q3U5_RHOML|nr:hypothetical protein RHMOL_Rhmol01G0119900 [Rhododendron molle]